MGGGTPTLALDSVTHILARVRQRFRLTGDICIETNPADVDEDTVRQLHDAGVVPRFAGCAVLLSQASPLAWTTLRTACRRARPGSNSFETICVNAGIPQRVVDTWLGHRSDRSMASVYYKLTDSERQAFMLKVPLGTGEPAADAGTT